jgi:hypothetical protein
MNRRRFLTLLAACAGLPALAKLRLAGRTGGDVVSKFVVIIDGVEYHSIRQPGRLYDPIPLEIEYTANEMPRIALDVWRDQS